MIVKEFYSMALGCSVKKQGVQTVFTVSI